MMSHVYTCHLFINVFTRYVFYFLVTFSNYFFLWILSDNMSVFLFLCRMC